MVTEMQQPNFWTDQIRAQSVGQKLEHLRKGMVEFEEFESRLTAAHQLATEADQTNDQSVAADIEREISYLQAVYKKIELATLLSGPYDSAAAIVSIHAGTGGTEAQDWAEMLLRMILRYSEQRDFSTTILDESRGNEAGIKSVTVRVTGPYAYGYLKSEAGVHRLVRISPFDAEKMRHTSFALIEVVPELPDAEGAVIDEKDLKIDTMRAGGHGGQGVNTTDSAVRITHLPSGITVKCQNERSQVQNRQTALKILKAKLTQLQAEHQDKQLAEIRGELLSAAWGNQLRSYVLHPYELVKDHRTGFESIDPDSVLEGQLDDFVESYLRYISTDKK